MASSSNVGLTQFPWGRLPRSPVTGVPSQLEISFRDIMAEQQRESSQDKDFDEYIQKSYVTVGTDAQPDTPNNNSSSNNNSSTAPVSQEEEGDKKKMEMDNIPDVEKSFMQLEDLDTDLRLVMSFYEDQDFDDAAYGNNNDKFQLFTIFSNIRM